MTSSHSNKSSSKNNSSGYSVDRRRHKPTLHQNWIDPDAIDVVQRLQRQGHETYLVGGCVRDLLVGYPPKDFDIATMATPKEVKSAVPRSYIIGKRFRLVLVKRGDRQFEVATFRKNFSPDDFPEDEFPDGPPSGDNIFGTPEEDAERRDFTINALFYDPISEELIDFNGAMADIESRTLRMIGEPNERLIEDPIRILRALRLSHKLGFSIEPSLREAIVNQSVHLPTSVLPRRREEFLKFLRLKKPALMFQEAYDLNVLEHLSPSLHEIYRNPESAEIFNHYLEQIPRLLFDPNQPIELFGRLTLAYCRAHPNFQSSKTSNPMHWPTTSAFDRLLKEELGTFRYEQSYIGKACQMMPSLQRIQDFLKKGDRKRMALLKQECFPLSLLLSEADHWLSPSAQLFWQNLYDEALPEIRVVREQEKLQRSERRNWKRKSRSKPSSTGNAEPKN